MGAATGFLKVQQLGEAFYGIAPRGEDGGDGAFEMDKFAVLQGAFGVDDFALGVTELVKERGESGTTDNGFEFSFVEMNDVHDRDSFLLFDL